LTHTGQWRGDPDSLSDRLLGYTLSVVVQAIPEAGFAWMARLVDTEDTDVLWIIHENLKTNRLVRHFPERVEALANNVYERN
jgi:hypothetical protein